MNGSTATGVPNLARPVTEVMRLDVATLQSAWSVREALESIRQQGVGEKIVYFYVVDADGTLCGVVPTRRLLTSRLDQPLSEVMLTRVAVLPSTATVFEACEAFVMHRFLAFPVVDAERRIMGVVDVGLLAESAFDIAEIEQADALFEALGFHVAQVRDASSLRAFRFRFPWLLATIASGTACALLTGVFEATLEESLVLAFFITLVLGLGESVAMQSMTLTVQALRSRAATTRWYVGALRREGVTAGLIGVACGALVGSIVGLWRGDLAAAISIGGSVVLSILVACLLGVTVPWALHASRLDPKIAAGPITLALADIFTLTAYFGMATLVL